MNVMTNLQNSIIEEYKTIVSRLKRGYKEDLSNILAKIYLNNLENNIDNFPIFENQLIETSYGLSNFI